MCRKPAKNFAAICVANGIHGESNITVNAHSVDGLCIGFFSLKRGSHPRCYICGIEYVVR